MPRFRPRARRPLAAGAWAAAVRRLAAALAILLALPALPAAAPLDAQARVTGGGAAWSLPDPDGLIQKAITRIITQDRPAGIPIANYADKRIGRDVTRDAVRRFAGRTLGDAAFAPVAEWQDAATVSDAPLCASASGAGCTVPTALWLAVSQIERGDLSHELHLWYTIRFQAPPALDGEPPQVNAYVFCERWLRVGGVWKYDGFVRMKREAR